jgi:hypothetical protein
MPFPLVSLWNHTILNVDKTIYENCLSKNYVLNLPANKKSLFSPAPGDIGPVFMGPALNSSQYLIFLWLQAKPSESENLSKLTPSR